MTLSVVSLDEAAFPHKEILNQHAAMPKGQSQTFVGNFAFSKPGYYRLRATLDSQQLGEEPRNVHIGGSYTQDIWIVVDEDGGRVTAGFDESVFGDELIGEFGAYGAFRKRIRAGAGASSSVNSSILSSVNSTIIARYNDPMRGVRQLAGARVVATCYDANYQVLYQHLLTTDANGYATFGCPDYTYSKRTAIPWCVDGNVLVEDGSELKLSVRSFLHACRASAIV
ncbi:MAG: hypothetical protein ACT4O1_01595 [Gemmatimonadota bacterium]